MLFSQLSDKLMLIELSSKRELLGTACGTQRKAFYSTMADNVVSVCGKRLASYRLSRKVLHKAAVLCSALCRHVLLMKVSTHKLKNKLYYQIVVLLSQLCHTILPITFITYRKTTSCCSALLSLLCHKMMPITLLTCLDLI